MGIDTTAMGINSDIQLRYRSTYKRNCPGGYRKSKPSGTPVIGSSRMGSVWDFPEKRVRCTGTPSSANACEKATEIEAGTVLSQSPWRKCIARGIAGKKAEF